jgi:hypothetical protein
VPVSNHRAITTSVEEWARIEAVTTSAITQGSERPESSFCKAKDRAGTPAPSTTGTGSPSSSAEPTAPGIIRDALANAPTVTTGTVADMTTPDQRTKLNLYLRRGITYVIAAYADRFHQAAVAGGAGHHIASPLGAWIVLSLAADALDGPERAKAADTLGCDVDDASAAATELLSDTHPAVAAAAACWTDDARAGDRIAAWAAGLPAVVGTGPVPSQDAGNRWAAEKTDGLRGPHRPVPSAPTLPLPTQTSSPLPTTSPPTSTARPAARSSTCPSARATLGR